MFAGYAGWILRTSGVGAQTRRAQVRQAVRSQRETPRSGLRRHIAIWFIFAVVMAVNAFWWWPGIFLASTKGKSDFAFAHPEGVGSRLLHIVTIEAPVQAILLGFGLPGVLLLLRRMPVHGWALLGFAVAGLFWGYLAGALRSLDFLQPGRHTYALFTALSIAGGGAIDEVRSRVRRASRGADALDRWILAGALLIGVRLLSYPLFDSLNARLFAAEPFLSSRPSPRLLWVLDRVQRHLKPGERLLYEESGFDVPGVRDPFQRGRFSGLLPGRSGVELIGGPYLHASLSTNFTQFGEGKLFGREDWDRDFFVRYAKLYRPAGILCWSPHARRFCKENPDLVRILDDDGSLMIGRVVGFEGAFIVGSGEVRAEPGRIRVRNLTPDLDGSVVLRYHSVPGLVTRPSVASEPDYREDDPVPFLRLRPTSGVSEVDIDLHLPGWP
jgi:hypothetical protein